MLFIVFFFFPSDGGNGEALFLPLSPVSEVAPLLWATAVKAVTAGGGRTLWMKQELEFDNCFGTWLQALVTIFISYSLFVSLFVCFSSLPSFFLSPLLPFPSHSILSFPHLMSNFLRLQMSRAV